jgi:hypothetical protein
MSDRRVRRSTMQYARWSGLAATLSGVLLVAKGIVILVSEADPSLVPPATLLLAIAMLGFAVMLRERGGAGLLERIGQALAWVVIAASVVNLAGLARGLAAPGAADAPAWLRATYLAAFLGIVVGLPLLGVAALRAEGFPPSWRIVPLAVGIIWFPLQGVGQPNADGVGLVLGGVTWMCLGYVLWSRLNATDPSPPRRARSRTIAR